MRPGDVITCTDCGATAEATWESRERAWADGWALRLTWRNGPFPRAEATLREPERCLWCHDAALGYAGTSILNRPCEDEVWTISGPLKTYTVPATPGWKRVRPPASREGWEEHRSAGEGPLNGRGASEAEGALALPPGKTDGNKAPLERPAAPPPARAQKGQLALL